MHYRYVFCTLINKFASCFYTICQNYVCFLLGLYSFTKTDDLCCCSIIFCCRIFVLKPWFTSSKNNANWFFSKHFISHFYFLWIKVMSVIFTFWTMHSNFFPSFYRFYFWLCVFHVLYSRRFFVGNTLILLSNLT